MRPGRRPTVLRRVRPSALAAALLVPLALAGINVRALASAPYLRLAYARPGFPASPGFTARERLSLASESTAFVAGSQAPLALESLRHRDRQLYTPSEIEHLLDVQRIIGYLEMASPAALALLALAAAWHLRRGDRSWPPEAMRAGGWACLLLGAIAALGVLAAWGVVFAGFHEALFRPGTWQFPIDSALIRLFPEVFWRDAASVLLTLTLAEGALLVWLGRARPAGPAAD